MTVANFADEMKIVERHMANPPVFADRIIEEIGIRLVKLPLEPGQSGKIIRKDGGRYEIQINSNEGPKRQRFTAAHELAHFLLHRDLLDRNEHLDRLFDTPAADYSPYPLSPEHEVQANKMAAQILMPAFVVRKRHEEGMSTRQLAEAFAVSEAAMRIRLKVLGLADR